MTETTLWPGSSRVNRVSLMAAMPVEKLVAASALSSTRSFSSKAATVGLVFRP